MRKKLALVLCLIFVLTSLFSACGSKSDAKLVYWTMWNETEPQGKVIGEAVKAYTEKTGVQVEVNFCGRDIRTTLQPALDAGTQIDIFDEDVERVNQTWGNYVSDIEEMAAKTYDTTNGKPFTDVINTTLVDLARSLGPNGKLSSIPYQPSTFIVMYNKDIFDQAGITSAPKTWDEFLDACEKIKAIGKIPITVDDAYIACLVGYHMARIAGMETTLQLAGTPNWDNPAVLEFAEDWQEMYQKGYISPNAASNVWPAGQQEVAQENVAMYLNGTWLPNEIKDSVKEGFRWGSFAYPAVSNGEGPEANNFGSQCFAINKNSKYPQEAFDLIVFLTTGEWDAKLAAESLGVPMGNDSAWPSELAEAKAVLDSTTIRYPWAVGMENNADVVAKIKENFAKLVSGQLDAQGFVNAMK